MPMTVSLRSSGLGSSRWRREKARSWAVSLAPRSAAVRIMSSRRRALASVSSRSRKARLPRITVKRLLKSWATPDVSCPTASSRWA